MQVKDVMTKDIIFVDKDINLRQVLKLMKKHDIQRPPLAKAR